MANGMRELSLFAAGLNDKIIVASNTLKRRATMLLETNLTNATPIDTGAAISNWQVTTDAPATEIIEPYAPSLAGVYSHHSKGDVSGKRANAEAAVMAASAAVSAAVPGEPLFITNNDPAVWATDTGHTHTDQTAPGYVGRAVFASIAAMKDVKLVING